MKLTTEQKMIKYYLTLRSRSRTTEGLLAADQVAVDLAVYFDHPYTRSKPLWGYPTPTTSPDLSFYEKLSEADFTR